MAGNTQRFIYDSLGRLAETDYYAAEDTLPTGGEPDEEAPLRVVQSYDALGRVVAVDEFTGGSPTATRHTDYAYDVEGRVIELAFPEGTLGYEYSQATGQLTRTWSANLATSSDLLDAVSDVRYDYDSFGRLWHVRVLVQNGEELATPDETTYAYDLAGNLDTITRPAAITDYDYDRMERLVLLRHLAIDETPATLADNLLLSQYVYERNASGQIDHVEETTRQDDESLFVESVDYLFDDLGRLIEETRGEVEDAGYYQISYVYDLAGNRLSKTTQRDGDSTAEELIDYVYDDADRLLSETLWLDGVESQRTDYDYQPSPTGPMTNDI